MKMKATCIHKLVMYVMTGRKTMQLNFIDCKNCKNKWCQDLEEEEKEETILDWWHDDITWCARECPNEECFRNRVNRRTKAGLYSVGDMYKEGECPKEAKIEAKLRASLQGKQKRNS